MTRPGFASVMALVCLFLISVTILGLMTRIHLQSLRTASDARRAQREQIAIARSIGNATIVLPAELSEQHQGG
jgi:type II secretory pathway component PulK